MKKIISIVICCMIIFSVGLVCFAGNDSVYYDYDYSTPEHPFVFLSELEENRFSPEEIGNSNSRASINLYGYVCVTGNHPIYTAGSGTNTYPNAFLGYRERVLVISTSVDYSRYYIKYISYGSEAYGYVDASIIYVPNTGYAQPITSGGITNDYAYNNSTQEGHAGIDVGRVSIGTTIHAVTNVKHTSYIYKATINGTEYLVNYGNYISATHNGTQIIYAHLSSFVYGTANTTLPSYLGLVSNAPNPTSVGSGTPTKGAKIGELGNTGNSSGPHLHFETRVAGNIGTKYDPFSFVVFPDIGYD